MKPAKFFLLYLVLFCVLSCGESEEDNKHFERTRVLQADTVRIDQILHINNIIKLEDYVLLQNGSDGVDDFYFVYSLPDMKFLYSFARRGRGPTECQMPSVIKNTCGNILAFRDHANDNIFYYRLTGAGAEIISEETLHSPETARFFWEINCMNDSLYLIKHQGYKNGATELWKKNAGKIDEIRNTFDGLPKKLGRDYFTVFDDYIIASSGDKFVRSYYMINRIEFGKVENGKIYLTTSIGAKTAPKFHLYGKDTDTEFSIDRNIIYYENIYAGQNNIYALYSGKRLDETERYHSSVIEIYSWDGTPVESLHLEVPIAYLAVDEENRILYGVNPEISDEMIFKYCL